MRAWPTSRKGADSKGRNALHAPLRRLRDEILDLYLDWREQAAAVADAYASWEGAPAGEEGQCFAAYTAALDREQAAARSYADVLATLESSLTAARVAAPRGGRDAGSPGKIT
jgi:hypothetical protein